MAISDQLTLLNNTKTAIRTAINNKGGSVGASDTFASYATAIDNLPSGGDDSTLRDLIEQDITSITIPSGTTKIGYYALCNCASLVNATIPNTVTTIEEAGFKWCRITNIVIPDSVTSIGKEAFYENRATNLTIGSGVRTIGINAFGSNSTLQSITVNATTPPTLSGSSQYQYAFYGTTCPIYVPAESVDTYKAASNWSTYASRIQAIPTE